jgi:dienelactone hydrolase
MLTKTHQQARKRRASGAVEAVCVLLVVSFTEAAQIVVPRTLGGKDAATIDVPASTAWTDSGMDLAAGDHVRITAEGTIKFTDAAASNGPEGLPRGWRDLIRRFPLASANRGALLARIGEDATRILLVGKRLEWEAGSSGRLFFGLNMDAASSAQGSFRVTVEIVQRAAARAGENGEAAGLSPAAIITDKPVPGIDRELFRKIPRRVADTDGTAGDMVNFLLLGPETEVRRALEKAGWVLVNRSKRDALIGAVLATLSKQAYVELPMSELLLFGRAQDFGFAQGEPFAVITERHHFRLWRAPMDVNGVPLWVGAGTHDVGFDRDARNGKITHKIDPEVDKERDYIAKSLADTGQLAQMTYVTPPNPVQRARTAHGQEFFSDGRVLVMVLRGADRDRSVQFAQLFCAVLSQERPDEGEWAGCGDYLEAGAKPASKLSPLAQNYRVLVVPGVFNVCASKAPAFEQGRKHLIEHGIPAELLAVPNDTSEANGRRIMDYIRERSQDDPRKYIVIGYSKGAPDAHEAVVNDSDSPRYVAAFVSVAGAVGGTPIADTLPSAAERWMNSLKLGGCEGDMHAAMRSLRRDVRKAFLQSHQRMPVPMYSFAAVAEEGRVSKALQETWKILQAFDRRTDAQLTLPDQIVPGSIFLGAARADHFAVALPFDLVDDEQIRRMADRNRYPRTALLEAIVRFVALDLGK